MQWSALTNHGGVRLPSPARGGGGGEGALPAAAGEPGGTKFLKGGAELVGGDAERGRESFEPVLHPLLNLLAVGPVLAGGVTQIRQGRLDLIAGDVAAEVLGDGVGEGGTVGTLAAGVVLEERPAGRFHRIGELLRGHAQLGCRRFEPLQDVRFDLIAQLLEGLFDLFLRNTERLRQAGGEVAAVHPSAKEVAKTMAMRSMSATRVVGSRRCGRGRGRGLCRYRVVRQGVRSGDKNTTGKNNRADRTGHTPGFPMH